VATAADAYLHSISPAADLEREKGFDNSGNIEGVFILVHCEGVRDEV